MELHIEAQHTELEPELKLWITDRLDALNAPEQDIPVLPIGTLDFPS